MLLDSGADGRWATAAMIGSQLAAPSLIRFEVATISCRHQVTGFVSSDQAAQAHADLLDLAIEEWPYELLAERAWALRRNLMIHDASYVALAELLGCTLLTLDERIRGAPGVRCQVSTL